MSSPEKKKRDWKKILIHELVEYWINVAYLAVVFAVFTNTGGSFWPPMISSTRITGWP